MSPFIDKSDLPVQEQQMTHGNQKICFHIVPEQPAKSNFTNANVTIWRCEQNYMTLREASNCHLHLHLVVVGVLFFQGNATVDHPERKATFTLLQLDRIQWG